jgi:tRNA U34 5-methylaminomethyl-2-thiouridine-forming methyltransferase MnmC
MKRTLILCSDGTSTIQSKDFGETYHSIDGAVQESRHVYIHCGLNYFIEHRANKEDSINILEIGFGTGLNALLTIIEQHNNPLLTKCPIYYETVELYPLEEEEWSRLNYPEKLSLTNLKNNNKKEAVSEIFKTIHQSEWGVMTKIGISFNLMKRKENILDFEPSRIFDIVFFDAFSPNSQPELWGQEIFNKIAKHLHNESILTTYSSKGDVKRALRASGFIITRLHGVGTKRHIIRGIKNNTII